MNKNIKIVIAEETYEFSQGLTLEEILEEVPAPKYTPLAALVNGEIQELTYPIYADSDVVWIDQTHQVGMRIYKRSLFLVLATAIDDVFPGVNLKIAHSLSNGTYCELRSNCYKVPVMENIETIRDQMRKIVDDNRPIEPREISKNDAIKFFENQGKWQNANNIRYKPGNTVRLYSCGGVFDYFYEPVASKTGILKYFDVHGYHDGLILSIPTREDPYTLPVYEPPQKLAQVLLEGERWGSLLEVENVAQLNKIIEDEKLSEFVQINETLHERKLYKIGEDIGKHKEVKLVLIAGPSSSGKTTFAERLYIQLRVNGIKPVTLSLDNYFVNRDKTPKDEFGALDFESLYALDLDLFNQHLVDLIEGKEVTVPRFDFHTGTRMEEGDKVKIEENQLLIVEGIHALNEKLTKSIPHKYKRKIYISALTQINVDDWTPISSSDTRLIRRIYRDIQYRGASVQDTIKMWPSVRRGEEKNIFPFQEEADYMFNSSLIYEKSIFMKLILPELEKIIPGEPEYHEAQRLIRLLQFFVPAYAQTVPINSILREFTGGSCFHEDDGCKVVFD